MYEVFLCILIFSVINCEKNGILSIDKINPWANTDGAILYNIDLETKIEVVIPEECSSSIGICENIPRFPHEVMAELINILITDKVQFHKDNEITEHFNLYDRDEESQELCQSKRVTFQPQAIRDSNGTWHLALNSKYKNVQSFNGEVCLGEPKKSCSDIAYFNTSYEGRCVQKYRSSTMIALSNDFKQIILKAVLVPTCCSCVAFKKD